MTWRGSASAWSGAWPGSWRAGEKFVTAILAEDGRFYPVGERAHLLKDPDAHRALEALRADLAQHAAGPPTTTPRCSCSGTTVMGKENLFPSRE